MKSIIIEDEKPSARMLQRKLEKLDIRVDVMLHSVSEAIDYFLNNEHPDLIFLDIQLSDGLSFEIFEKVKINSAIIFTTAFDEYALKAFKLNSVDYLLKPIDEDDLSVAVEKFKANHQNTTQVDFEQIRRMLTNPFEQQYKQRFTVKVGQYLKLIDSAEIECFYSENKGTCIHTVENRDYLIESTLEMLEADLDPKSFFRISRKFIIPIKSIKEIVVYTNSRLKIVLPTYKADEVIVSREKVSDFKNWLA